MAEAPADWRAWLHTLFPEHVGDEFAPRHSELWRWVWSIQKGIRPRPLVAVWPRGGGKSTSAELAVVAVGARAIRPYVWYVRETQDQADLSVANVSDLLESDAVEAYYPKLARREVGKFGQQKAWRRNRLRTASGFTVDAIGLDTAVRGAKVKTDRPGFIILDDIDGKHDQLPTTRKKIDTITTSLLPAGSRDVAVLGIQNLIIPNGVFSRLANVASSPAEFLADRIVSGPYPAVENLEYEQRQDGRFYITSGRPTWTGQNLQACQEFIDTWGITAFLKEAQHEVEAPPGGIWDHIEFRHCSWDEIPDLVRGCVWVDPAVTATDESDAMGIQVDGIAEDGTIYRLYSWEDVTSPEDALRRAITKCLELGFTTVGVETDQGGDVWRPAYARVWDVLVEDGEIWNVLVRAGAIRGDEMDGVDEADVSSRMQDLMTSFMPEFREAKAGAGYGSKVARNQQMLVDYEHGRVVHARGQHQALEKALRRFPKTKPLDLADAAFWGWEFLRHGGVGMSVVIRARDPLADLRF